MKRYRSNHYGARKRARYAKKKKLYKIGVSPRIRMPCKAVGIGSQAYSVKAIGRIHSVELTDIQKSSTLTSSHTQRLHDHVVVKGFQICKWFENINASELFVNVAVVTSKVHDDTVDLSDGAGEWNDEFFRDWETTIRTKNFLQNETPTNTSRSGLAYYLLPINSDRWIVHKRWRKKLEGSGSPDQYKRVWLLKKWVKFNRQLVFDDDTDHPETGRTFVIYWFDFPSRGEAVASGNVNVANHTQVITTFFRDAKLC